MSLHRLKLTHVLTLLFSITMTAVSLPAAIDYRADDPRISYEGRTAPGPDHSVRLGFPGITVRLRANAASIAWKLNASSDTVYFDVSIDGKPATRVHAAKGAAVIPLELGASAGGHTITLTRRNECWQGSCDLLSVEVTGGELLDPPPLPARKLMFIGDSVTCGEGTEPEASTDPRNPVRANAAASYGIKLARRLGAQCHLVSYGGRGIIRDWQGIRATNNAPQFYELAFPDDATARWDHARYVPDAIGVCLGTNDFNQGVPDENEFVNAFVEFVRKLQRDAPQALIFLIDSPILNDGPGQSPKRSVCGAYLDEIVRKVDSPNVRRAVISHYKGAPDNAHPTGQDHTGIANELEPIFRAALNWRD
jgi:hypothetical protein